jgi:hypothetical protein
MGNDDTAPPSFANMSRIRSEKKVTINRVSSLIDGHHPICVAVEAETSLRANGFNIGSKTPQIFSSWLWAACGEVTVRSCSNSSWVNT